MRTADAQRVFQDRLSTQGLRVQELNARTVVESMLAFYVDVRAEDVDVVEGGDTLLFQWGSYDWGERPSFDYDLTRQFIINSGVDYDDDAFWQLSLTIHFDPGSETDAIGRGERWCEHPAEADDVRSFIEASAATAYARRSSPASVELRFEQAG